MTTERKRTLNPWPLFIVLLACCFLGLSAWSVRRAVSDVSPSLKAADAVHKRTAAQEER